MIIDNALSIVTRTNYYMNEQLVQTMAKSTDKGRNGFKEERIVKINFEKSIIIIK